MSNSDSEEKMIASMSVIDMSSAGIASRLREVSELYELGQSLSRAKPLEDLTLRSRANEVNDSSTLPSPADDASTRD